MREGPQGTNFPVCQLRAPAEDGQTRRGPHSETGGGRLVSAKRRSHTVQGKGSVLTLAGRPTFGFGFLSDNTTVGAPSLRSLQGRDAMTSIQHVLVPLGEHFDSHPSPSARRMGTPRASCASEIKSLDLAFQIRKISRRDGASPVSTSGRTLVSLPAKSKGPVFPGSPAPGEAPCARCCTQAGWLRRRGAPRRLA